jgi:hypothetical protein
LAISEADPEGVLRCVVVIRGRNALGAASFDLQAHLRRHTNLQLDGRISPVGLGLCRRERTIP